jgi:hypothetical protein
VAGDVEGMREALAQIARIAQSALNGVASEEEQGEGARAQPADSASSGQLIQVFYGEKDACSRNNVLTVPGKDGRVSIRAGETKFIEMESLVASFYWRCGDTEEKFKYDNCPPFNYVKVERSADTGRIAWTCYVKT